MSSPIITAREWIGHAPYPWPAAHSLCAGDALVACFALTNLQVARTRQDRTYLKLLLTDRHGRLEARVWDDAEQHTERLEIGAYIGIRGHLEVFNGERQLRVEAIAPVRVDPADLELFLPRSPRDARTMERELAARIRSVADLAFRALLERLLGPDTTTGSAFRRAPAAKQNHHAYLGGLLEHTLSVSRVCHELGSHYAGVDRDLLVTAALLHDLGKIREIDPNAGFSYTDEGKLLGHILLGLQMVADAARAVPALSADRLLLLQHLIASHQGRYEWQSPREPRILEGLLLHYADDLDAKMQQATSLLGEVRAGWTTYDRAFGREFLRHLGEGAGLERSMQPVAPHPPDPTRVHEPAGAGPLAPPSPPGAVPRNAPPHRPTKPPADDDPILDLFGTTPASESVPR